MMSKKQLACMLALHIVYLLVGASIFYHIESPLELAQRAEEKLERLEIQNLLYENYIPDDPGKQDSILRKLSEYCGKSMFNYTTEDAEPPFKWDFYHSFFFSYTVVSTIGYGNLAPTTHLSRILMIFYGLFGIPINGILLANLGEYFGLQLISVYRKYKRRNEKRADRLDDIFHNFGMLGQIFLYLVPGFLFFIFLPACIFVVFEGWDYVAGIYYAFVTLTTIGFGDLVAGTVNNGFKSGYFLSYQIFLIIWITFGLGYIVMLLGFITSGMRSERIHRLEQKFSNQVKSTQSKILQGFTRDIAIIRKIINEANLLKFKPVYVEAAPHMYRSSSCPTLTFDVEPRDPIVKRKRANSENIQLSVRDMLRIQSDTDLLGIDKEKTFTASAIVKPVELLARVVNVLGGFEQQQQDRGIHIFDDDHILASERPPFFSIGQDYLPSTTMRTRALSVAVPNYRKDSVSKLDHDFTWTNGDTAEKYRKEANIRSGKLSLPAHVQPMDGKSHPKNFFARLFRKPSSSESPTEHLKDIMKASLSNAQVGQENIKEKEIRGGIFSRDEHKSDSDATKDKNKIRRHSIFPIFDFSEEENRATTHQHKPKRHSIFPSFDFSEDENEHASAAKAYKEKTRSGRHSIFPTFDFSDPDDDANRYKENTRRGRHSIFPTFDFNDHSNDDDTVDEDEASNYKNRTRRGRLSLFPTFGKSRQSDDDTMPESSDELVNYKEKTRHGRRSLFPSFGKSRKVSTPENGASDLETSVKQYQNQTRKGRSSCFAGDIENYRQSTEGGRGSLFSTELDNYRNRTRRGRPSLFDPDVNLTNLPESEQVEVLENTSVADLLRALAVLDTVNKAGPSEAGADDIFTSSKRRGSIRPDFNLPSVPMRGDSEELSGPRRRRISVRAAAPQFTPTLATVVAGAELQITAAAQRENRMTMLTQPPPPYTENAEVQAPRTRRYSPAPVDSSRSASAPVARLFSRMRKESSSASEESSRRNSLTDIVIDSQKDKP